jgi:hypothetical protein
MKNVKKSKQRFATIQDRELVRVNGGATQGQINAIGTGGGMLGTGGGMITAWGTGGGMYWF